MSTFNPGDGGDQVINSKTGDNGNLAEISVDNQQGSDNDLFKNTTSKGTEPDTLDLDTDNLYGTSTDKQGVQVAQGDNAELSPYQQRQLEVQQRMQAAREQYEQRNGGQPGDGNDQDGQNQSDQADLVDARGQQQDSNRRMTPEERKAQKQRRYEEAKAKQVAKQAGLGDAVELGEVITGEGTVGEKAGAILRGSRQGREAEGKIRRRIPNIFK